MFFGQSEDLMFLCHWLHMLAMCDVTSFPANLSGIGRHFKFCRYVNCDMLSFNLHLKKKVKWRRKLNINNILVHTSDNAAKNKCASMSPRCLQLDFHFKSKRFPCVTLQTTNFCADLVYLSAKKMYVLARMDIQKNVCTAEQKNSIWYYVILGQKLTVMSTF